MPIVSCQAPDYREQGRAMRCVAGIEWCRKVFLEERGQQGKGEEGKSYNGGRFLGAASGGGWSSVRAPSGGIRDQCHAEWHPNACTKRMIIAAMNGSESGLDHGTESDSNFSDFLERDDTVPKLDSGTSDCSQTPIRSDPASMTLQQYPVPHKGPLSNGAMHLIQLKIYSRAMRNIAIQKWQVRRCDI